MRSGTFMLLDFFLFHHVQFILVGVYEFVLQEAQTLIRNHFNTHRVFQFPFPTERESSTLNKCCNIRMYVQGEFLHVVFVDQAVDLSFQAVGKQDRGFDGACAETGRTGFGRIDIHCRTDTLTGDLHQAEFAQRQNIMFCPVTRHRFQHVFIQFLPVGCF